MSNKVKLVIVGVLLALASAALAGTATAKETKLRCEGAGACTFTVSSGVNLFSLFNGDTIKCEASSGSGQITGLNAERESTTGTIQILYTGCKEQNTAFHFACQNTGTAGNVTTNVMTVHSVALPGTAHEAGVLVTGLNVTFTCAGGFAATQSTGSIIGEAEEVCDTNTGTTHKVVFTSTADGVQALTSYTGLTFRHESKTSHSNAESQYVNSAQNGTGTLTFNQNVLVTCG